MTGPTPTRPFAYGQARLYVDGHDLGENDDGLAVLAIEHKGHTDRIVVRTDKCHGQSPTNSKHNLVLCHCYRVLTFQVDENVVVHRRFVKMGRVTVSLRKNHTNLLISHAPPKQVL